MAGGDHPSGPGAALDNFVFDSIHAYTRAWTDCSELATRARGQVEDADAAAFADGVVGAARGFTSEWGGILADSAKTARGVVEALDYIDANYRAGDDQVSQRFESQIRAVEGNA